MKLSKITKLLLGAALLFSALSQARADDKTTDPSGTYMWTTAARNGGADRTNTLVLKLDGDKLTGKLTAPGRGGNSSDTDIAGGKVTGSTISFCVIRQMNNGNSMTNNYTGTLANGTITGTIDSVNRNGEPVSHKWEATMQK